jgi:hypothetical protein
MKKKVAATLLIAAAILLACLPSPAYARGGMAMSGSFSGWEFNIPIGAEVSGNDLYVTVFNNTEHDLEVKMSYTGPAGVEVVFSEPEFRIGTGEKQQVYLVVRAGEDAVPGQYELVVTASSAPVVEGGTLGVGGALGQKAKLTISGDVANISATAVSPDGEIVPCLVRLFRLNQGRTSECASSDKGMIETRVSPGQYTAAAYLSGDKLAEETFSLAANENKQVALIVQTVCFEGFDLVPNYRNDSNELVSSRVVYTIKNLYKALDQAEVMLRVSFDGTPQDELPLANLSPLELGRAELSYNYVPSGGWRQGVYRFSLDLNIDGKTLTSSPEKELAVNARNPILSGIGNVWRWPIVGGIGGAILLAIVITMIRRRSYQ